MRSLQKITACTTGMVLCLCSLLSADAAAQYQKAQETFRQRGEVYFKFRVKDPYEINFYQMVSLDKLDYPLVYAYANKEEFEQFTALNSEYEILTPPSMLIPVQMSDSYDNLKKTGAVTAFDFFRYPTYQAYVQQMQAWPVAYPTHCQLLTLGYTANNRHAILCLRIAKDLAVTNGKAKFLHTNAIHGDEVVTSMIALHLMDTLLSSYGRDTRLTRLVDNIDFYFVPFMNPDGTYRGGDNTVTGAQRYNVANNWDLNRNYPDLCGNANHAKWGLYTGTALETQALLDLHAKYIFHIASDDHGGIEAIFWPYGCLSRPCCDETWFRWACKRFADQVHVDCNNNGYYTSAGGDGMGKWFTEMYEAHGTRVDYETYHRRGKGFGPETSITKILAESNLPARWQYLREAYLQFYELLYTGIQGIVTDSITGQPILNAKMTRNGDFDNADVLTDSLGYYCRFADAGTYTLTYSADGYRTKTFSNYVVSDYTRKYELNVQLVRLTHVSNSMLFERTVASVQPFRTGVRIILNNGMPGSLRIGIYNVKGTMVNLLSSRPSSNSLWWDGTDNAGIRVSNGYYVVKINGNNTGTPFILSR